MSGLREVCEQVVRGTTTLVQLAMRGELRAEHVWVGVRGGGRYAKAVASGDVARDEVIEERLRGERGCLACPAVTQSVEAGGYVAHWCGRAFEERIDEHGGTCGCLCEAKASVASEACPRGRWGPSVACGAKAGPNPPMVGSLYP